MRDGRLAAESHSKAGEDRGSPDPLNRRISGVLVAGLAAAVALLAIGVILILLGSSPAPSGPSSIAGIPQGIVRLDAKAFFDLGVLVLLATPAARVVALLGGFVRRREWLFAGVSGLVLAVLTASAYLGIWAG